MKVRRVFASFLVVASTTVAVAAPAAAHDHRPPEASIVSPHGSADGVGYTATWAKADGPYCAVMIADGVRMWDRPVRWAPTEELAIRFDTRHRPRRVDVDGYLVGDPLAGVAVYGRVEIPHELRRVRVDGRTMWEAVLDAPPSVDLYLDVTAAWRDLDGCGMQSVSWTFRAGLLPV